MPRLFPSCNIEDGIRVEDRPGFAGDLLGFLPCRCLPRLPASLHARASGG
eukprot:COSAG01_NODE_2866_length_6949_cov_4.994599_5_plen_50_part_00